MKDFFDHIFSHFKPILDNASYRINNPFGGAFLFSWIILNWKTVYFFILGDGTVLSKIKIIENYYLTKEGEMSYFYLIWLPAFAATLFIALAPALSNLATTIWLWSDRKSASLRIKFIEKSIPISPEDQAQMYAAFESVKKDFQDKIQKLEEENRGLRKVAALKNEQFENNIQHDHETLTAKSENNSRPDSKTFQANIRKNVDAAKNRDQDAQKDFNDQQTMDSKDLYNLYNLKSNAHNIEQWIGRELKLKVDYNYHYAEILDIKALIGKLIQDGKIKASTINEQGRNINLQQVTSFLIRMELSDVVERINDATYELTEATLSALAEIVSN
ncbi:hypothetical protein [Shewanella pneumatophori]|uniref:Uncharacterized protein n=1 Tax=Shewanella pneumatophori TaxID=314092 RepID=A0A9X1ZAR6_9GAMM|nr:hypothetical protein [Shewanella pneumatophori]MCL1138101.1 hypothetical protein [Shewanella pneumatophori]